MTQKLLFFLWITLAVLLVGSCKKENRCDCFKSTGSIVSESRNISGFTRLMIKNDVNVYLKQDSLFKVEVSAGKNLIALIKTEVKDGELTIKNSNTCNFVRSYEPKINIYISMPVINYITHEGTGIVKSENTITTPEFDVWTKSSGDIIMDINNKKINTHLQSNSDITLTGQSKDLSCFSDHNGMLHAENLMVENHVWFYSKTAGDAHFFIKTGVVDITIIGLGNIYYLGNPTEIQLREEGKGKLIKQ